MTALASVCAIAGVVAICEEMRKLGMLDEVATSRVEQAMRSAAHVQGAPFDPRRQFGALLDIFFGTMREKVPVNRQQ